MDPVFRFRSIAGAAEGILKEKGSKFLAFAYPVESVAQIQDRLQALKKNYYDASHHCYAWVLGADKAQFRANDDGEPKHSAGDPILGQIRSRDLTNVLVVVVRYFGGTKLGVGGLVSAYRSAAEQALSQAAIVQQFVTERVSLKYSYADTSAVMKVVNDFQMEITNQQFGESCEVTLTYKKEEESVVIQALHRLNQTTGSVEIKK